MTKLFFYCSLFICSMLCVSCDGDTTSASKKQTDATQAEEKAVKTIVFYGNSLTAGYGLETSEAFPAIIQHKIDSLGMPYRVVNAGVSGETTAGGNSRIEWILKQPIDVFVLELGANDGLRGIPVAETRKNLQAIIDKVRAKYPGAKIVLAGMQIPPSMGAAYADSFRDVYTDLAAQNNVTLIPFLLEGVGGIREYNLPDGIHPTAEGHKIVAENVWDELKEVLQTSGEN